MSSEKWLAIFEVARAEGALDADALVLISQAIDHRDTNAAREILARTADCLGDGKPIPRLMELYLAYSLQSIALGEDPAQALHLRANSRTRVDATSLMELFYVVEWHKRNGATSEKDAIRRAATQVGLKVPAAEKRFVTAKATHGAWFEMFSDQLRALDVRIPTLGEAILSSSGASATNKADRLIDEMIDLIGAPKKGVKLSSVK